MLTRRLTTQLRRWYSQNILKSPFGDLVVPRGTVDQYTTERWSQWEDKTAIECGLTGKRYTYRQLRSKSKSFGVSLAQLGFSRKSVLFVLPNCPEFPLALLGALQVGMTVSAANPMYTTEELRHQTKDAGVRCVVTDPPSLEKVRKATAGLDVAVICTGAQVQEGVISFEQLSNIKDPYVELLPPDEDRLNQLAMLPYSSGTTGLPKGVRLRHFNIIANVEQINHPEVNVLLDTTDSHQDVVLAVLPFFHIYGATVLILRSLRLGAKIVSFPKFHPESFLKVLKSNKDIVLQVVPTIVNFLANDCRVRSEDLQGLRVTTCGAAPSSSDDLFRLAEKWDHTILQAYGMTEASPLLTLPRLSTEDRQTIGLPLPGTEAKVIHPETGEVLRPNTRGVLCFKGPQVMEGYHNNPKGTADTLDLHGWLNTGDIGYCDDEGNFFIVDRLKELIKVKGFQVAPAELEAILKQHPMVADAAVTSEPCPRSGEVPVAFLVAAEDRLDPAEVDAWISSRVASYKRPARMVVVKEVPKSPYGKILRTRLKEMAKYLSYE